MILTLNLKVHPAGFDLLTVCELPPISNPTEIRASISLWLRIYFYCCIRRRCCAHLRATTPSCSEISWIGLLPFGRSACARENERRDAAALGPGAVNSSQLTIYSALIAGGELLHFKF